MFGSSYLIFTLIFAVVLFFEYDLLTKPHMSCEVPNEDREHAEIFCMARTSNLRSDAVGAYLRNYGRWQFFIIVQMFIMAISCRFDLKIRELRSREGTVGKRYILTVGILLSIIVCWICSDLCLGRHFTDFISGVFIHAVDRNPVISPLEEVFPMNAKCLLEFSTSNDTAFVSCRLPLHATTPYYFLALFFIYILGFLLIATQFVELAKEKIAETRNARKSTVECPAEGNQKPPTKHTERRENLLKKVAEKVKCLAGRSHLARTDLQPLV